MTNLAENQQRAFTNYIQDRGIEGHPLTKRLWWAATLLAKVNQQKGIISSPEWTHNVGPEQILFQAYLGLSLEDEYFQEEHLSSERALQLMGWLDNKLATEGLEGIEHIQIPSHWPIPKSFEGYLIALCITE